MNPKIAQEIYASTKPLMVNSRLSNLISGISYPTSSNLAWKYRGEKPKIQPTLSELNSGRAVALRSII